MNVHSVAAALSITRTDQTRIGDAGIECGSAGDVRGADEISRVSGSSPSTTTLHTTTIPKRRASRAARARDDNCNRFDAGIWEITVQRTGLSDIAQKLQSSRGSDEPCDKTRHRCLTNDCPLGSAPRTSAP